MKRRKTAAVIVLLLVLLAVFGAAAPSSAAGRTVGVILPGDVAYYWDIHAELRSAMKNEGLSDVEFVLQKPYPDPISLSNAARKLIAVDVDVIVTYGAAATLAAVREGSKIPIVYAAVYEPVAASQKWRRATGVTANLSASSLLRYLRKLENFSSLGILYSSDEEDSVRQLEELAKAADQYGIRVERLNLSRRQDIGRLLAEKKPGGLIVTSSAAVSVNAAAIRDYARTHKIPTAVFLLDHAWQGTITLTVSAREQGELVASKVAGILHGSSPERLRPDASRQTELIFNLREATAMGWKIPLELVTEATNLIK